MHGGGAMTPQGMPAQGGSHVAMPMQHSPSGPYHPASDVHLRRKSNTGIIIAILVVLAAGGAIAAVVLLGGKGNNTAGPGSGSDVVASTEFDGNALTQKMCACKDLACADAVDQEWTKGYNPDSPHKWSQSEFMKCYMALKEAANHGSGTVPATGSDHTGSANVPATGSDHTVPATGSDHTLPPNGSDTGNPPAPTAVMVTITTEPDVAEFQIFEGTTVVPNAFNDGVPVEPGKTRTLVLKSKGYKDKTFTLDSKKKRFRVTLARVGGGTTTNNNHPNPPQGPDCSNALLDGTKHCRDVYCSKHPDDSKHGCDNE
jgi:hypothetical protein